MSAEPIAVISPDDIESQERSAPPVRVALVNMPFALADRPSIQCGLLKGALTRAGHQVDVIYLNLELAAELGALTYKSIASMRTDQLVGEWLFSTAAFGPRDDEAAYRAACPGIDRTCDELGLTYDELCRWRSERMPLLIERWCAETDWSAYTAVGFTSTFEQNVAALALARAIKARHPAVQTIFGGANYDGEMGPAYMRAFPWIDYVVVGEGDDALPRLVNRIARGESGAGVPGVAGRVEGAIVEGGPAPSVRDMDRLADPDFNEYFATLYRLGRQRVLGNQPPTPLYESARGCWWGQKHHCTFCGLNANGMAYRSKGPAAVHDQLRRLAARYQIVNFEAVDNIIDMRYLEDLCRPLIESRVDYSIFYEVKANLTRTQLRTMSQAGIHAIQPGIESLSTHVLGLMRKGTTMIRNVRLIKWAHYYGMRVGWNILVGFPGEQRADYNAQRQLLPLLYHLPPPSAAGPLWMERFSPYFTDPSFPVRNMRPHAAYAFVYPPEQIDLNAIAYFFDYEMDDVVPYHENADLFALVDQWKALWQRRGARRASAPPSLMYQRSPDWLQVLDRRDPDAPRAFTLHAAQADAYEFCGDTDHPAAKVAAHLNALRDLELDTATVTAMLRGFCEQGLMIEENSHFLSLALPVNPNW